MNLWPFSKKTDSSPTISKPSGKMELPPGVMLASPDELDLSSEQPAPVAATAAEPESATPSEASAPETHTLEDLALLPVTEATSTADEPKDLSDFFEKHQLEMISTGSQPDASHQDSLPEINNADTPETPGMALESGVEAPSVSLETEQSNLGPEMPPVEATAASDPFLLFPDLPNANTNTLMDSLSPDFNFAPATNSDPLAAENPFQPTIEETASLEWTYPAPESSTTETPLATSPSEELFGFESSLQDPAPQTMMGEVSAVPEQTQASFAPNPEGSANNPNQSPDNFYLFPTENADPASQMDNSHLFGGFLNPLEPSMTPSRETASDLSPTEPWMPEGMPEAQTESPALTEQFSAGSPPQPEHSETVLNDFAMSSPMTSADLDALEAMTANFEMQVNNPTNAFAEPVTDILNDETFDLDSILLGAAEPIEPPSQPTPSANTNQIDTAIDKAESTDTDILDHYFGDEAQGLKGNDNLESYDFGHYEDPDAPAQAFVLDEEPASSILNNLSYDQYYSAPDNELSFSAKLSSADEESSLEEQIPEAVPESGYTSFLFGSENADATAESQGWPQFDSEPEAPQAMADPEPAKTPAPKEPTQELQESAPPLISAPEIAELQPEQPKPLPEKMAEPAVSPASKVDAEPVFPHSESILDAMNTFSQDVLLHSNRFLGRSIDRLVDAYFAQEDQNSG